MPLFNKLQKNREQRHFIGMTRSGQLIEDPKALELNEEMIVDPHDVAFDDDRQVPYRVLMLEGLPAVLRNYVQLYTGGSRRSERDPDWLLVKRFAIFGSAARAAAQAPVSSVSFVRKAGLWVLGAGIIVFFICLLILGIAIKGQQSAEEARNAPSPVSTQVAPAETEAAGDAAPETPGATVVVADQQPRESEDGAQGAPRAPSAAGEGENP